MVICQICKKEYKIITQQHLDKHDILVSDYKIKYPNCNLICEKTRAKYKEAAENYNKIYGSPILGIPKSKEHINNIKIAAKNRTEDHYKKIANNKERNTKISKAKKEWWNKKTPKEKSNFIKEKVIPKIIENEGIDSYLKRLRKAGIEGHNKVRELGKKKISNTFEKKMIEIIRTKGYSYIEQFEIDGYFYDSYIPEKKLIIEFDGDYWHPKTINDCINNRLKRQWNIDRYKDDLAKKNGYDIIRIRESEKDYLLEIL